MILENMKVRIGFVIWFGGKHASIKKILPYFPQTNKIISPFLGGGSIELVCANNGIEVIGNDKDPDLINCWRHFQNNKEEFISILEEEYMNLSREHWRELKKEYKNNEFKNDLQSAVKYLALNKSAFSGQMAKKNISYKRKEHMFLPKNGLPYFIKDYVSPMFVDRISKLNYRPITLSNKDWKAFLDEQNNEDFIYLDPPYFDAKDYYEIDDVNHYELKEYLDSCPNWALSYKKCDEILELYKDYRIVDINYNNFTRYAAKKELTGKDILILSNGIK